MAKWKCKYCGNEMNNNQTAAAHKCGIDGVILHVSGMEKTSDPVNNPSHYNSHPSGVECITVTEHMTFNIGNAVKYLWRAGLKIDALTQAGASEIAPRMQAKHLEDLRKARWYISREIKKVSGYEEPRFDADVTEVLEAARKLIMLKNYEQEIGKDAYYEREKPVVWDNLRKAFTKLDDAEKLETAWEKFQRVNKGRIDKLVKGK